MSAMREDLEQRRDGMWTGAYVSLLLVVPAVYGAVVAPGLVVKGVVIGAAMALVLAGYVLATCARDLGRVLHDTLPPATAEAGLDHAP